MWHSTYVEARRVTSFLTLYLFQISGSGCQALVASTFTCWAVLMAPASLIFKEKKQESQPWGWIHLPNTGENGICIHCPKPLMANMHWRRGRCWDKGLLQFALVLSWENLYASTSLFWFVTGWSVHSWQWGVEIVPAVTVLKPISFVAPPGSYCLFSLRQILSTLA